MRIKRWIIPILILAGIIAAIVYGMRPQPVMVELAEVKSGQLRVTVDEEGKTRIKERYVVSSTLSGQMQRINLDEGDAVSAGQVVTRVTPLPAVFLDPRTRSQGQAEIAAAETRIHAAQERVRAAKVNLDYWHSEVERNRKLVASGDIAKSRLDQLETEELRAQAQMRELEAAVESAQAELKRVKAALEQTTNISESNAASIPVAAPVGGRVIRIVRDSAGPVTAGEPLIEVANSRAIEVEVEVLSPDAVKIKPGTRVLFTRWGGNDALEGTVQRIEPTGRTKISALGVEEQRVPVIAIITSPEQQWQGLGAGYRVEASFIIWEAQDVLQIPTSAVFQHEGASAVFIAENNFARRRKVTLGQRAGLIAQVLDGLKGGEKIIAHPDSTVDEGKLIQAR